MEFRLEVIVTNRYSQKECVNTGFKSIIIKYSYVSRLKLS